MTNASFARWLVWLRFASSPDTASLLASYRVTADEAGDITGYERTRRYHRGEAD
jgi:hypothetical protein